MSHPLTAAQRRLWFLDRLEPGDPAYHISTTVLLRGDLDVDRLIRAFDAATARHESLRTRFLDGPVQEVLAPRPTLFLTGGLIEHSAGSSRLRRIGGLMRATPFLAAMFLLEALSHVGVPPL